FARIYPVYVVSGIAMLPLLNITQPNYFSKLCFILGTNILLIQAWFPPLFNYWNDGGTWSLSVEAFCYVLFPSLLWYLSKQNNKKLWCILFIAYVWSLLASMSSLFDGASFPTIYSLPIYRLPEFIVGMIAGLFFLNRD